MSGIEVDDRFLDVTVPPDVAREAGVVLAAAALREPYFGWWYQGEALREVLDVLGLRGEAR